MVVCDLFHVDCAVTLNRVYTADLTKPGNSPHHNQTTRSQRRATRRYAADQSSAASSTSTNR
jgi:hypothetical protein